MTSDNKEQQQGEQQKSVAPADKTDLPSQQRVSQPVQPERQVEDTSAGGGDEVTEKVNADQEKGYHGHVPDDTPNSAYTFHGVASGESRPDAQDEPMSPGERK